MTLMQNNGKLTQKKKNQSGETANGPKIGVISMVQLFPLA